MTSPDLLYKEITRIPFFFLHSSILFLTLTYLFAPVLSVRHGDGLYDSYMRTDHILKDEADTNSPSGLPPMPKHTVSKQNTHAAS